MSTNKSKVVASAATTTRKSGKNGHPNMILYLKLFQIKKKMFQFIEERCFVSDRKFFLDAIPMTGTHASVAMLTKLIADNEVTGVEADMWMTTLAFIPSPSKDMIREVMVR